MPVSLLPFLPGAAALLAVLAVRAAARWRPALLPFALPLGLSAGAVVLTLPFNLRAVWAPRVPVDHVLLAAAFGVVAASIHARMRRRWAAVLALAFVTGWWVAHAPPALPEFWRVGLAVTVYALALMRCPLPALGVAAAMGAAALWMAGAAPLWPMALLVPAAAAAGCAVPLGTPAPPRLAVAAFLAAGASLASLAGGRITAGRFTAVDAAAGVPLLAAWLWPVLARVLPAWPRRAQGKPRGTARRVAVRRPRA